MLLLAAALACVDCHKEIVERYARTPMANTSGPVVAAAEHPGKVDSRYRITPRMTLIWSGGELALTFFVGSRRMGRSYAYERDGHLFQAPVGYYANREAWDLAPGYEHDSAPDLNRPITADCLICHATATEPVPGTLNRFRVVHPGIQCERCHGTESEHGKLLNPAKLSPRARDSVCEQCHLSGEVRLLQAGKRLADFRPGKDIGEYLEVFTESSRGVKVNGHAEALASSRCKQSSGNKIWCGTCHSPHRKVDANAACKTCHATAHHQEQDCAGCHMPKSRAYDGGHTVFTDHAISLRPRERPFGSYFNRPPSVRNLGLAYVEKAKKAHDTSYLEKAWPLLRQAALSQPNDPALYAAIAAMLEADGKKEQAVFYYRLALRDQPLQPDALSHLAKLVGGVEGRKLREQASQILGLGRKSQ